jgi:hypothetical protein
MESTLIDENTFRPDRMSTAAEPIFVGASSLAVQRYACRKTQGTKDLRQTATLAELP